MSCVMAIDVCVRSDVVLLFSIERWGGIDNDVPKCGLRSAIGAEAISKEKDSIKTSHHHT